MEGGRWREEDGGSWGCFSGVQRGHPQSRLPLPSVLLSRDLGHFWKMEIWGPQASGPHMTSGSLKGRQGGGVNVIRRLLEFAGGAGPYRPRPQHNTPTRPRPSRHHPPMNTPPQGHAPHLSISLQNGRVFPGPAEHQPVGHPHRASLEAPQSHQPRAQ